MKNLISKIWPWAVLVLLTGVLIYSNDSNTSLNVNLPVSHGVVARVIDGDTFDLSTGERVRLIGIDTPERSEAYYDEARSLLVEFVEGSEVALAKDVSDKDQYGRLLRYVYVEDIFINNEMLLRGFARATPIEPDTLFARNFFEAQKQAEAKSLNIWE